MQVIQKHDFKYGALNEIACYLSDRYARYQREERANLLSFQQEYRQ